MGVNMKKILLVLFTLLFFSFFACAEEEKPLSKKLVPGDTVTLKGSFQLYNGMPPNIRFVTYISEVIGIGTEEDSDNEIVNNLIKNQIDFDCFFKTEAVFKYDKMWISNITTNL